MLNINSILSANRLKTDKNNTKNTKPVFHQEYDTVCFKGKSLNNIRKFSLINRLMSIIMGGSGLAAIAKFLESLSEEDSKFVGEYLNTQFTAENNKKEESDIVSVEQGRIDFKEMKDYQWVNKYKKHPEIFEKLLLEEDEHENETGKRLYFVHGLDVIGAFNKNKEALERVYTLENIKNIEMRAKAYRSPIYDLQKNCKEFIDNKMFESDENGKILLHIFIEKFKNSARNSSPLIKLNRTYSNELDKLTNMYLVKDSEGKYPLEYLKDKSEEDKQIVLQNIKETFLYKTDLYEKVLSTYDLAYLAKEKEMQEKVEEVKKQGWEFFDKNNNKIIAKIRDRFLIERLIKGEIAAPYEYKDFEKYNPEGLLIEKGTGDDFYTDTTEFFYNDKNVCIKKVRHVSSKYNGSTETSILVNGEWKSDKDGGWKDW